MLNVESKKVLNKLCRDAIFGRNVRDEKRNEFLRGFGNYQHDMTNHGIELHTMILPCPEAPVPPALATRPQRDHQHTHYSPPHAPGDSQTTYEAGFHVITLATMVWERSKLRKQQKALSLSQSRRIRSCDAPYNPTYEEFELPAT